MNTPHSWDFDHSHDDFHDLAPEIAAHASPVAGQIGNPRPFVGLLMRCCRVYARIYRTAAGDAFAGHCPRCGYAIRVPIVEDGGNEGRFFAAG